MKKPIAKFNSPAAAERFIYRAFETCRKTFRIIMGDDQLFWIVTMAEAEKLIAGGYEELPR